MTLSLQSFEFDTAIKYGLDVALLAFHLKTNRYEVFSDDPASQIAPSFPFWSVDKVRRVFDDIIREPALEGYILRAFAPVEYISISVIQVIQSMDSVWGVSEESRSDLDDL